MILQLEALVVTAIITLLLLGVIMFLIGVALTKWLAGSKGWNDSFKTALIINLLWFVLNLLIGLIFSFALPTQTLIAQIITLIINIILGAVIVSKIYEKEFGESLVFVLIIQIILFIIGIIVGLILAAILVVALFSLFL